MIAPMFAAIAGVLLVALFPTAEERRQWRKHRARHLLAYYRAPWSRALQPGGALVDPFTINAERWESVRPLSDTRAAHEKGARQ